MTPQGGCSFWNQELGRYDFDTFTVWIERHHGLDMLEITATHEFIHHNLTVNTTFGELMGRIKQKALITQQPKYSHVLNQLVSNCGFVHEMAATYESLTQAGRQDLVDSMPDTYQIAFERCTALVDRAFGTTLLRRGYAQAVARCAMMTETGQAEEQLIAELLAPVPPALPPEFSPDIRLAAAERMLLSLPKNSVMTRLRQWIPGLDPLLYSENQEDLLDALGGDWGKFNARMSFLGSSLISALGELLKDTLPNLSQNYSAYRLRRKSRIMDKRIGWLAGRYDAFQPIRDMANQTVAFHGQSPPQIDVLPRDSAQLMAMAQNSLRKTGAIYFYVESRVKGGNGPRCFLTDMSNTFPRRLLCYPLDQTDGATIPHWAVPRVTLIEREDLAQIEGTQVDQFTYWLLEPKSCFVHISGNPIDLLVSLLTAGASVQWSDAVISYDNESISEKHQLHIVLYAIEGSPYRLFHLSYPSLRWALLRFCHLIVKDESRLRNIAWSEAQELFDQRSLNWLSDHPVFSAAHLFGKTLEPLSETGT